MPAKNLSRIFGPNIVGFSVEQPLPEQMMTETEKQFLVGILLIKDYCSLYSLYNYSTVIALVRNYR